MKSYYQISYLAVSYTFLFGFLGYLIAAFACDVMHRWIGRWGVVTLGGLFQLLCFVNAYFKPPFELFVLGYFISGFGNGLIEASVNAWAGNLNNNNAVLGLAHGFYSLGGILSPAVIATLLLYGYEWNFIYGILAVFAAASTALAFVSFSDETAEVYNDLIHKGAKEAAKPQSGNENGEADENSLLLPRDGASSPYAQKNSHHHDPNNILAEIDPALAIENLERELQRGGSTGTLKQVVSSELFWIVSFALFVCCGVEIGIGGWITTFMIDVRHGNEKTMGYVGTAYWVGMAIGRMGLGFLNDRVKMKPEFLALVYVLLSLAILFVFWVVPDIGVSSVCAPLIGFFTAPLYPSAMIIFLEKVPEHLHVVSVGCLAAAGGIGCGLVPFVIGVLTSSYGVWVLAPVSFGLMATMLAAWSFMIWRF